MNYEIFRLVLYIIIILIVLIVISVLIVLISKKKYSEEFKFSEVYKKNPIKFKFFLNKYFPHTVEYKEDENSKKDKFSKKILDEYNNIVNYATNDIIDYENLTDEQKEQYYNEVMQKIISLSKLIKEHNKDESIHNKIPEVMLGEIITLPAVKVYNEKQEIPNIININNSGYLRLYNGVYIPRATDKTLLNKRYNYNPEELDINKRITENENGKYNEYIKFYLKFDLDLNKEYQILFDINNYGISPIDINKSKDEVLKDIVDRHDDGLYSAKLNFKSTDSSDMYITDMPLNKLFDTIEDNFKDKEIESIKQTTIYAYPLIAYTSNPSNRLIDPSTQEIVSINEDMNLPIIYPYSTNNGLSINSILTKENKEFLPEYFSRGLVDLYIKIY